LKIGKLLETIKAIKHVIMKAPKQLTKVGIVQTVDGASGYGDDVQKVSALAGVEGNTS
jgi:hypothetical protein